MGGLNLTKEFEPLVTRYKNRLPGQNKCCIVFNHSTVISLAEYALKSL